MDTTTEHWAQSTNERMSRTEVEAQAQGVVVILLDDLSIRKGLQIRVLSKPTEGYEGDETRGDGLR